jgi:hypothetical protein
MTTLPCSRHLTSWLRFDAILHASVDGASVRLERGGGRSSVPLVTPSLERTGKKAQVLLSLLVGRSPKLSATHPELGEFIQIATSGEWSLLECCPLPNHSGATDLRGRAVW